MNFEITLTGKNGAESHIINGPHAAINKFNDIKTALGIGGTNLDSKGNLTAANKDYTLTLTNK